MRHLLVATAFMLIIALGSPAGAGWEEGTAAYARGERPGLDAMLKAATRSEFDMVAAGLGLYVHKQGLDTSMPSGRAMFGIRRSETTA